MSEYGISDDGGAAPMGVELGDAVGNPMGVELGDALGDPIHLPAPALALAAQILVADITASPTPELPPAAIVEPIRLRAPVLAAC